MAGRTTRTVDVRAVLARKAGREVLILRPHDGPVVPWELPGGELRRGEDAATGLARLCREALGLEVELGGCVAVAYAQHGRAAECRFFMARPAEGVLDTQAYAEARWVLVGQLCEYDFDTPTHLCLEVLANQGRP